jgi:hypothetical protein
MPGGAARGMTRGTPEQKPLPAQKISIKGPLEQVNQGIDESDSALYETLEHIEKAVEYLGDGRAG